MKKEYIFEGKKMTKDEYNRIIEFSVTMALNQILFEMSLNNLGKVIRKLLKSDKKQSKSKGGHTAKQSNMTAKHE